MQYYYQTKYIFQREHAMTFGKLESKIILTNEEERLQKKDQDKSVYGSFGCSRHKYLSTLR